MFQRKSRGSSAANAPRQVQPSVSVTMPMYRLVKIRQLWLGTTFFLGMITQFLLAIYTPTVWNYLYDLLRNFLPM